MAINQVWMHHFETPLVPSVFDFGRNGKPPTIPGLLDWLAAQLKSEGWRMKPIHRLIVLNNEFLNRQLAINLRRRTLQRAAVSRPVAGSAGFWFHMNPSSSRGSTFMGRHRL